jgi:hypothetical protein
MGVRRWWHPTAWLRRRAAPDARARSAPPPDVGPPDTLRPRIKHIAGVKSIQPWNDTGKSVVSFAGPAREIGPIPLVKGGRGPEAGAARLHTLV